MKSRRSAVALVLAVAMMISAVTIVSAHAAKSKAQFGASALVLGVGPGEFFDPGAEFSTKVTIKYTGEKNARTIDSIRLPHHG